MIFQSGVSWRIDVYPTYAKANEVLGPSDKLYLVHMRNLGYYLDRRWEADFVFERYTLEKVLAGASSAGDLTAFFRGRGVTHLSFTKKYLIHHFLERRYFQKSVRGNKRHILSG